MKIYITGGAGFVGSHLTGELVENGHEVTVGGLNTSESVLELPDEVEREKIDVTDPSSLSFDGFDAIIHLVALSPLQEQKVSYRKIHVEGTRNVVEAAEEASVEEFVHVSALGADEEADTKYLRTKGEAQSLVEESELDWRVFRPSAMFGEGGEFLDFLNKFSAPYLTLQPGRDTLFQPLYVEDAVEAMRKSLKDDYSRQSFNIGGPEELSLGDIVEAIWQSRGIDTKVIKLPDLAFKTAMKAADPLPLPRFGMDQYRSLRKDNVVEYNDMEKLGIQNEDMTRLGDYIGEREW